MSAPLEPVGSKTEGQRFSSPREASIAVAGMGLMNQTFLDSIRRNPGATIVPVVEQPAPKRSPKPPAQPD